LGQFVIARGNTSELFDAIEESFYQDTVFVNMMITSALHNTVGLRWDDGLSAGLLNTLHERVGVIALSPTTASALWFGIKSFACVIYANWL